LGQFCTGAGTFEQNLSARLVVTETGTLSRVGAENQRASASARDPESLHAVLPRCALHTQARGGTIRSAKYPIRVFQSAQDVRAFDAVKRLTGDVLVY